MQQEQLDNWFSYHAPVGDQVATYQRLRDGGRVLAYLINDLVPESADKSAAIRKLRECIMTANAAIACGGK